MNLNLLQRMSQARSKRKKEPIKEETKPSTEDVPSESQKEEETEPSESVKPATEKPSYGGKEEEEEEVAIESAKPSAKEPETEPISEIPSGVRDYVTTAEKAESDNMFEKSTKLAGSLFK